ncbi:hypothetical protein R1sor_001309 [Riccia sorocarpa]|uniref:Uncharacterized protein n=1 Tax=Riccia sorocarpa TaxID=122646 RepID=A0ABD3GYP9_9MARC
MSDSVKAYEGLHEGTSLFQTGSQFPVASSQHCSSPVPSSLCSLETLIAFQAVTCEWANSLPTGSDISLGSHSRVIIDFWAMSSHRAAEMHFRRIRARDYRIWELKAYFEDGTGELEATAWEATRCFIGMPLDEFVAKEMCDDEAEILERCISRMWILRLGRSKNHRGIYARIEYADVVSRKVLFHGNSPSREQPAAESLPSSPVSTISVFGDVSSPVSTATSTCEGEYGGEKPKESGDVSRESFRRGFETCFVTEH